MRGSSSSSISTSQDHLTQFQTSPNNIHTGFNQNNTQVNRMNSHHHLGSLQQNAIPPPIKQRSFVHSKTNGGNNHESSPQNQLSSTPIRQGTHAGVSPYANASAAETDLLNNSFGSDKGSHSGSMAPPKSTKLHHAPRHAPKQPPPPAPIMQGNIIHGQPPYIPPPQPKSSISNENNRRKISSEQSERDESDYPNKDSYIDRSISTVR